METRNGSQGKLMMTGEMSRETEQKGEIERQTETDADGTKMEPAAA